MDLKLNSILILLVFTCFAKGDLCDNYQDETITGKEVHHGGYSWICNFKLATDGSNDVVTACSTVTCNRPKAKIIRDLTVHGTYGSYKLTFNTKNSASVRGTLEIWGPCPASYPYGSGNGPVYISFSDRGELSNGLLSKIEMYWNQDGINSLKSTFGGDLGPLHGTETGASSTVNIWPGFYITSVSGTYGAKINSLNFHFNDGGSTGDVGVYAGHEFEAFPPHSDCFLAYLSGSDNAVEITLLMFNWACGGPQNQAARKCEAYPSTLVPNPNSNQRHIFTDYPVSEPITEIRVYTGPYTNTVDEVIKCIQVKYGTTWGEKHGQHDTGATPIEHIISSPITGVTGTAGARVNNFKFKTLAGPPLAFGVDGSGTPPYDADPPCTDGTLAYISGNYYQYPSTGYTLLNGFFNVVFHWKCPDLKAYIEAEIGDKIANRTCPACGDCASCCGICLLGDKCVGAC